MSQRFHILSVYLFVVLLSPASLLAVTERQAAKETHIPNIRLLPQDILSRRIQVDRINIAYVEQDTKPGGGKYFCGAMTADSARVSSQSILQALQRMPSEALSRIKLKYVLLCSEAKANGTTIGGIPVPPINLLMLSTGTGGDSDYLERTFLHELYHMAEFVTATYKDSRWNKTFKGYSRRYVSSTGQGKSKTVWGGGGKGFINAYAKSFPHEDRAELFALGLMDGHRLKAFARERRDSVLQNKLKMMKHKVSTILGMSFL